MLEGLKDLAKVFSVNSSYAKFVEFAELREKGLRKSALNTLAEFIGSMKERPFAERKDFVSLFCETSLKWRRDSYFVLTTTLSGGAHSPYNTRVD